MVKRFPVVALTTAKLSEPFAKGAPLFVVWSGLSIMDNSLFGVLLSTTASNVSYLQPMKDSVMLRLPLIFCCQGWFPAHFRFNREGHSRAGLGHQIRDGSIEMLWKLQYTMHSGGPQPLRTQTIFTRTGLYEAEVGVSFYFFSLFSLTFEGNVYFHPL